MVVTDIFPDGNFPRPRLAVFAFASQNKNIAAASTKAQNRHKAGILWWWSRVTKQNTSHARIYAKCSRPRLAVAKATSLRLPQKHKTGTRPVFYGGGHESLSKIHRTLVFMLSALDPASRSPRRHRCGFHKSTKPAQGRYFMVVVTSH